MTDKEFLQQLDLELDANMLQYALDQFEEKGKKARYYVFYRETHRDEKHLALQTDNIKDAVNKWDELHDMYYDVFIIDNVTKQTLNKDQIAAVMSQGD